MGYTPPEKSSGFSGGCRLGSDRTFDEDPCVNSCMIPGLTCFGQIHAYHRDPMPKVGVDMLLDQIPRHRQR